MIYVSIASYKDPELIRTVESVLYNAKLPSQVRIGICQQDDPEFFLDFNTPHVNIIHYDATDSAGVGWARGEANQFYNGEDYFLQIDSHIEMVKDWDFILHKQMQLAERISSNKKIFAAYPSAYEFVNGERKLQQPYTNLTKVKFIKDTNILEGEASMFKSARPIRAKYLNAGFMFGHGDFIYDCPHDPEIYFWGEEILNTAKAYTSGYDLFHPSVHMCWHNYNRTGGDSHHWNAEDEAKRKIKWEERDKLSRQKVSDIFSGKRSDCLGSKRSLTDFAEYLQVDFEKRTINSPIMLNGFKLSAKTCCPEVDKQV